MLRAGQQPQPQRLLSRSVPLALVRLLSKPGSIGLMVLQAFIDVHRIGYLIVDDRNAIRQFCSVLSFIDCRSRTIVSFNMEPPQSCL